MKHRPAELVSIAFFIFWCASLILFNQLYDNEVVAQTYHSINSQASINSVTLQEEEREYYDFISNQEYLDTEVLITGYINDTKVEDFISNNYPKSPLINKSSVFFQKGYERGFNDQEIRLLIAIAGTESGFGSKAAHFNAWGLMCYRNKVQSTDCGWDSWDYAIGRAFDLAGYYLHRWDGTKEGLENVFVGKGKYCSSSCINWASSTDYFYNNLNQK